MFFCILEWDELSSSFLARKNSRVVIIHTSWESFPATCLAGVTLMIFFVFLFIYIYIYCMFLNAVKSSRVVWKFYIHIVLVNI